MRDDADGLEYLKRLVAEYLGKSPPVDCRDPKLSPCKPGTSPTGCATGWYIDNPPRSDIRTTIRRACLSNSNGKLHPHQRRLGRELLRAFSKEVEKEIRPLGEATDFEAVHAIVSMVCQKSWRAGPLLAYDVSLRICRACGKGEPAYVYLHCGAAEGARSLGIRGEPARIQGRRAPLAVFPEPMRKLTTAQAEQFLCVYQNRLPRLAPPKLALRDLRDCPEPAVRLSVASRAAANAGRGREGQWVADAARAPLRRGRRPAMSRPPMDAGVAQG